MLPTQQEKVTLSCLGPTAANLCTRLDTVTPIITKGERNFQIPPFHYKHTWDLIVANTECPQLTVCSCLGLASKGSQSLQREYPQGWLLQQSHGKLRKECEKSYFDFCEGSGQRKPKHPRKHTTSKKATTNTTLHVCTLKHQCNSLEQKYQPQENSTHCISSSGNNSSITFTRETLGLGQS